MPLSPIDGRTLLGESAAAAVDGVVGDRLQHGRADLGVHDDREVGDLVLVVDGRQGVEEGHPDALLEHAAGEVVGHLEVEGSAEHALRFDQVDEAVQLRA